MRKRLKTANNNESTFNWNWDLVKVNAQKNSNKRHLYVGVSDFERDESDKLALYKFVAKDHSTCKKKKSRTGKPKDDQDY